MSVHVPYRSLNRSQKERVGGVTLSPTSATYVNVESSRIQRDLARHSSIGAFIVAGNALPYTSDGFLTDGARVSKTAAGSLNLTITQGFFQRANGNTGSNAATAALALTTGAANPRLDLILIDTAGAAFVKIDGTATAGATINNRLGLTPEPLAANRIPVAIVLVPGGSPTNLDTATIVELR